MRAVVILRTLNEQSNVIRFCRSYARADKILIADGGSNDLTLYLGRQFDNVEAKPFDKRLDFGGVIFNDQPAQLNFLIDWAIDEGTDWIVYDDCDCVPAQALRADWRDILANAEAPVICAYRLYVWGHDEYLPRMSMAGQSLWTWRPKDAPQIRGDSSLRPGQMGIVGVPKRGPGRVDLKAPYCLMHYFAPDRAAYQRKHQRYLARGDREVTMEDGPYWPPEPLPSWARVNLYGQGDDMVKAPDSQLKLVKADTVKCQHCHARKRVPRWWGRYCPLCGAMTKHVRPSRPIGPASRQWPELVRAFRERLALFWPDPMLREWFLSTVEVRP